jgi:hypothetical protein
MNHDLGGEAGSSHGSSASRQQGQAFQWPGKKHPLEPHGKDGLKPRRRISTNLAQSTRLHSLSWRLRSNCQASPSSTAST